MDSGGSEAAGLAETGADDCGKAGDERPRRRVSPILAC